MLVVDDTPGEVAMAVVPDEEAVASLLDSLTISTAVISMEDGAFLKSLLQDQTPVTLALNWTSVMPRADKRMAAANRDAVLLDSLTISTAVISMEDGAFLKSLLQDQTPVTLALNWTSVMPRADK
ncbi:vacuolar-sorting receptor-like protein, partial [Haematococcus lacustris]